MKKVVALALVLVMAMLNVTFADNESSEKMQEVLLSVKNKITIMEELTEFEGRISDYKNKTTYNFEWHDEKYEKSISVTADDKGRILSYYNHFFKTSEKKLTDISKKEIVSFSQGFLKKTIPEMYHDISDTLVFDEDSYSAGNNSLAYSFTYNRHKNSIQLKDNRVDISVCVSDTGELFIRSMNANIDFAAMFEEQVEPMKEPETKYKEAFPVELVYKNEYNPDWKAKSEQRNIPALIYRIKDNKIGYLSIKNGQPIEEDRNENEIYRGEASTDSSMNATNKSESFTEKELQEIAAVEDLMSIAEIGKKIKKTPYVKLPESFTLANSSLSKNPAGKYIYNLYYESNDKDSYGYFNVAVYAEDGKLINLNYNDGGKYEKGELTKAQQTKAVKACEEFLKNVAGPEMESVAFESENVSNEVVSLSYYRLINGVKHISDGINVSYDAKDGCIVGFSLAFTEGEFADPKKAITAEKAYENLLGYSPVVKRYIKSGGKYIECITLEIHGVVLDALTGEVKNAYSNKSQSFFYSDIKGHWVEEAATKLAEIQIGFAGEMLVPDGKVTQEEFLRFASSGIYGKYYHTYSSDELYEALTREKVITAEEKNPTAFITREEAFVYIIRMINLERVARLENIYKIDYADSHMLSEGKIGYCALLSGMGVICGDGGNLRPSDNLTRAEAVSILYKYLLTI